MDSKEAELHKKIQDLEYELGRLKKKKYGLVWEDKPEKFDKESENALPILKEKGGRYKDIISSPDEDFNILIEGDNYHSLSVLSYTHKDKVDVIYIDPPYNTGERDFIYNDKFVDKEDPFRHSKWISFIKKRLELSKKLLTEQGIIFISIDDNESSSLKLLCDEIFGADHFLGNLTWIKRTKSTNSGTAKKMIQQKTEYIYVYSNVPADSFCGFEMLYDDTKKKKYPHKGKFGSCRFENLEATDYGRKKRDTMKFPILGVAPRIGRRWQIGQDTADELVKLGKIELVEGVPMRAVYPEDEDSESFIPFWSHLENIGTAESGKEELKQIVGPEHGFDTVKPTDLINKILERFRDDVFVLDFFAGSGTTGESVLKMNDLKGGNRRFILCTNNDNLICENITFPRLNNVIKGYENQKGEKVEGLKGNLKYLKTDFLKIDKVNDNLRRKMVDRSTEILCLKENTFKSHKDLYIEKKSKIFDNSEKYTAILFDTFFFEEFVDEISKLKDKPVSVYVFSHTNTFPREEFGDLNIDFTVEAIPEKILETYKKIFNF